MRTQYKLSHSQWHFLYVSFWVLMVVNLNCHFCETRNHLGYMPLGTLVEDYYLD